MIIISRATIKIIKSPKGSVGNFQLTKDSVLQNSRTSLDQLRVKRLSYKYNIIKINGVNISKAKLWNKIRVCRRGELIIKNKNALFTIR